MKKFSVFAFFVLVFIFESCSLKWLTKSKETKVTDRAFLTEYSCASTEKNDTFCLKPVGSEDIRRVLNSERKRLNIIYFVHSGCKGFHNVFLGYQSAFDSISDLSLHVIFGEDFRQIPQLKSTLLRHQYYGAHYILDENEYGRFNDPRTKNKKVLEQFAPADAKMMISPFIRIPTDGPYTPGYGFLTATMYLIYDENLNFLSASWDLSPSDLKRILNGEKPLQ